MNPELWKVDNYGHFLEARRALLADATNAFMAELLHGDIDLLGGPATQPAAGGATAALLRDQPPDEDVLIRELKCWVVEQNLPEGQQLYELADPAGGRGIAVLDLAWPEGLQQGLSEPVAVLLNEGPDVIACASQMGFRCFVDIDEFKRHVRTDVLAEEISAAA